MKIAYTDTLFLIAAKLASAVVEDIVSGVWKPVDYLDPMPVINEITGINENLNEKTHEALCRLADMIIASSVIGYINLGESKSLVVLREYFERNDYKLMGYNALGLVFDTALFLMHERHENKIMEILKKDEKDLF
jgi:hypothetical protein